MTELTIGIAVLAAVIVVLLLIQLGRSLRQERAMRDELARVSLALAQSQSDLVDRFHKRLSEFGQQVQGGQASTGEALQKGLEEARRTLTTQLEGLVGTVNTQLARSQELSGQQLEGATKVFGELKGQLGQVAEMAARMATLASEIEELQGILKAPKLRGGLGEWQLEEFLHEALMPSAWERQYRFKDGETVDAVIKLRDHLVPVDAKFPLEAFRRMQAIEDEPARRAARKEFEKSVKGRIDEIAGRYIRPEEETFEFALMFIPAEGIYYELIVRDESLGDSTSLLAYALEKKVVPVSPNSFFAYLSTIVTGLKGMQVEARAKEILVELALLQGDFGRLEKAFRLVGRHLRSAVGQYEVAEKRAGRFARRLGGVAGGTVEELDAEEAEALPAGDSEGD